MNVSSLAFEVLKQYFSNGKKESLEKIATRVASESKVDYNYLLGFVYSELNDMNN